MRRLLAADFVQNGDWQKFFSVLVYSRIVKYLRKEIPAFDPKEQARILKVLSVETRVKIVCLLKESPLCVNALSYRLGISQGAVSQHLRIMRDAGLVIDEKRGYYVHYRLNTKTLGRWKEMLNALFEPDKLESFEKPGSS